MKVYLYQKTNKRRPDGRAPIYYVLASGKLQRLISAQVYLKPDHFNRDSGQVLKGADNYQKLNALLHRNLVRLQEIIIDLKSSGQQPTFDLVTSMFDTAGTEDFIAFAMDEIKLLKGVLASKTVVGYKNSINQLKSYKSVIPFHAINHQFLITYRLYLINVKKRRANGYYQDFAAIKKFYRIAVDRGLARGNPFEHFKLKREETTRTWHPQEELQKLHALLSTNKLTEAVKNTLSHYLYSCFTGLRFADNRKFNEQHIVDGRIQLQTNKTGKHVLIPFNEQAKDLLPLVLARPLKLSNTRVNNDLDTIMQKAGIDKHVTFHCSRHTFAINCLLLGIDIITVRDWLGHSSVTTTEIYAKIADQYKDPSMNKFNGFLNKPSTL